MENKSLIIIAHGSRKESSNTEVLLLGEKVETLVQAQYNLVKTAFLEFTEPSLEECIKVCVQAGTKHIVILPYFLASGNHVTRDIPEIIQKMQAMYPEIKMELKGHIGSDLGMASLLSHMV